MTIPSVNSSLGPRLAGVCDSPHVQAPHDIVFVDGCKKKLEQMDENYFLEYDDIFKYFRRGAVKVERKRFFSPSALNLKSINTLTFSAHELVRRSCVTIPTPSLNACVQE